MKLKDNYASTTLLGKVVAVPLGEGADLRGTLKMNTAGAAIFDMLKKETTEEEIVAEMLRRFDVPEETLRKDVHTYLEEFKVRGLLA